MVAPKEKKLTPKQKTFCEEYLVDLNATQAAIRAGYSEASARIQACKMLTNPNMAQYIEELSEQRSKRTQIDSDWVLKTIQDTVVSLLPEPEKNASNIFKGAELLGKHLKLFTDKVEHSGETKVTQKVEWAIQPVKPVNETDTESK